MDDAAESNPCGRAGCGAGAHLVHPDAHPDRGHRGRRPAARGRLVGATSVAALGGGLRGRFLSGDGNRGVFRRHLAIDQRTGAGPRPAGERSRTTDRRSPACPCGAGPSAIHRSEHVDDCELRGHARTFGAWCHRCVRAGVDPGPLSADRSQSDLPVDPGLRAGGTSTGRQPARAMWHRPISSRTS
jgi:hypothetical protein